MRVPDEYVKIMYDLCIASMDFGSGFLDREDYDCLRKVADMLGVEYPVCGITIRERGAICPPPGSPPLPRCGEPANHAGGHKPPPETVTP